jgi:TonB family protein
MTWWQYLLLVNLYLVLFYGFYAILLRTETFFHLNRIYLVTSALLSFFIPLIHCDWISKLFITQRVQQTIFVYARPISVYHFTPIAEHHITVGALIVMIYAAGSLFLTIRLISQLISLRKIINEPEPSGAFAFFRNIRLGTNLDNHDIIAAHEDVHARQWHSADIMLIEAIAIINWFNPVVYFYRLGVKHIHEFIADRQALANGTTKSEYALLLLSQTLKAPAHQLVTPFFNHSLLKRRIIMLQKSRSNYMALLKYGLSAPLFMMMLVLSSAAIIKSSPLKFINRKAEEVFSMPANFIGTAKITKKDKAITEDKVTAKDNIADKEISTVDSVSPEVIPARPDMLETRSATANELHTDPIMVSIQREPQFKGGMLRFYQFLALNLHYPEKMMQYNIQGNVIIALTVEKDGSLTDIKSVKDVGYGSAEEAIRVLKKSPKWQPGYQNGSPVRVRYMLPISFNLEKDKDKDLGDTTSKVTFDYKADVPETPEYTEPKDTSRKYNMVLGDDFDFNSNALYLLDGKVVPDLDHVDFNNVNTMRLIKHPLKNSEYVIKYGDKALNGVVIIESKK